MEQARYLMWAKRKQTTLNCNNLQVISQSNTSSHHDHDSNWEEQAFAEDASGHLGGGCIWPPRSYSCSFCRREFRSAQALGGHMNVHRRDRARLKQSPNLNNDQILNLTPQDQFSIQNHPQVCAFVYNVNPNSDLGVINTSPISPSTNNNPILLKGDCETNLNLVLQCSKDEDEEEALIGNFNKRRKINPPSLSSFLKVPSEVVTYNNTQSELDLELRLGHRPKVKY